MSQKKALVCPLDWGLGHATRDVPIIYELLDSGFEVTIGADQAPLFFLRQHFPELAFIVIPSYTISYPSNGALMSLKMVSSLPKILYGIFREHKILKAILKSRTFDLVISDNRYGLWHKNSYTVFITHQLHILAPAWLKWTEKILQKINYYFIGKYNECWIPDIEGEKSLSGKLSHPGKLPANTKYIGFLSRFGYVKSSNGQEIEFSDNYDILVILSGPEPQRSMLEIKLLGQLAGSGYKSLVIQGKPMQNLFAQSADISLVSHLKSEELARLIKNTPIVITRSGYSGIMDLVNLGKSAILIPTPGQTEQEYLGNYMMRKKWFFCISQNEIDLNKTIVEFRNFIPKPFPNNKLLLKQRFANLV